MQIDMHYYGTYAMARAAGLTKEACRIIATAAQFVDDNAEKESITFMDGARLDVEATAHHAFDRKNIDKEDQRQIWVPFHFFPGNEGTDYTDRLICRKDSPIVRAMVEHSLSLVDAPFALSLMGITAHVYADTFSHYGFSGVSSRKNKIDQTSFNLRTLKKIAKHDSKDDAKGDREDLKPEVENHLEMKKVRFQENYHEEGGWMSNIKAWFAETASGALGHGAAVTFPDRPYLVWSFEYETTGERCEVRNNPKTFLEGCEALYRIFREMAERRPQLAEDKFTDFSTIKETVWQVLLKQEKKAGRIDAWQKAAQSDGFFATGPQEIPEYDQDAWHNNRDNLRRRMNSSLSTGTPIYRFYQAASLYRTYVLRQLFPKHGLVIA